MQQFPMPPIPDVIQRISDSGDRQLSWQFFVFFSRFEYALKRIPKYLKDGTGNAEAAWDTFANNNSDKFISESSFNLKAAVTYFKDSPPRKQKRKDRNLFWSEPLKYSEDGKLLLWLLTVVRTVRNNLFHGGKFPMLPVSDPSRNHDLIFHAIVILDACLKLDESVTNMFNDGINE